jgi:iron complex outermembrane receptor protein
VLPRREDEKENFSQPHFELLNDIKISDDLTFNSALFLVLGEGFFDYDGSWSIFYDDYFRLDENGFDVSEDPTNALIRAYVDNKQWGWIPRFSLKHTNGNLILGGEIRFHDSKHWGNINYAENLPEGVTKDYQYYYYEGAKNIFNVFANERYDVTERLNILIEGQLAYHKYTLHNEKYVGTEFDVSNLFFNPKVGLNYKFNPDFSGFFSAAIVSREPRLKNYYDAAESSAGEVPQFEVDENGNYDFSKPLVQPETLTDFELGITYNVENLSFNTNLFYMMFNDEIVKQGQVDRFGQPITGNMDKTIHAGIEFSGAYKFARYFELILNGAYSNNYISEGKEYLSDTEYIDLKDNSISGFPDVTFNGILKFKYSGLFAQLTGKYVGRFFSDNYDDNLNSYLELYPGFTDYSDNVVDAYFVSNFHLSYEFELQPYFNLIKVYGQVNNIFDNLYASYAIGKEFFPAAERYVFAGLKLGL